MSFAGIHCCTVTILAEGIRLPEHGSVLAKEEAVPCLSYFTVSLIDQSSWWHSGAEGEVTRATSSETSSFDRRSWGRVIETQHDQKPKETPPKWNTKLHRSDVV